MFLKRLTAAKSGGRKTLLNFDNLLCLVFIAIVLGFALGLGYSIFAYFTFGLLTVRIGEIIFESKYNLFDKPFFHYLVLIGIPAQWLWNCYH